MEANSALEARIHSILAHIRLPGWFSRQLLALALALALSQGTTVQAAAVTEPTQAALEAAMAGGGTVLFGVSGTVTLTNTITVARDTVLDANGNTVVISGGNAVRLFQVDTNVHFEIRGLTLADGHSVGQTTNADSCGGGILNLGGDLTLTSCTISNCYVEGYPYGGSASGGGIGNVGGQFHLTNCAISGNVARVIKSPFGVEDARGGGIYSSNGLAELQSVRLCGNWAVGGDPFGFYPHGG